MAPLPEIPAKERLARALRGVDARSEARPVRPSDLDASSREPARLAWDRAGHEIDEPQAELQLVRQLRQLACAWRELVLPPTCERTRCHVGLRRIPRISTAKIDFGVPLEHQCVTATTAGLA